MRRAFNEGASTTLFWAADAERCPFCGSTLWICQHRQRFVQRLDDVYLLVRQDKRCPRENCLGSHLIYRPLEDLRFVLPNHNYGFDVILEIGERHLRGGLSLSKIARDLNTRQVPVSQVQAGRLLRAYMALTKLARGDEAALCQRLRDQGGIVLMADGVQFDDKSPVLYLVWDAVSGEPLFGERKPHRSEADLVVLFERVKAMGVPVIGAVTDKEKGLVPALERVFPDVPYQFCQLHFLKNCALAIADDLQVLAGCVAKRAKRVSNIAKRLHDRGVDSIEHEGSPDQKLPTSLQDEQFAAELCAMARHASRASGRAPLNPPDLVRHQRMEEVREAADEAAKKGGDCSSNSREP